ncbi:hypothetical protein ACFXPS_15085 [Nocardia sp. NPDC059091]|uniref:hypothetical protein n=1 Tax=unclassified Nocardia TaxID=2637762 RepID=UPI0036D17E30
MAEFESYRANLEVADLTPTVDFLRDVLGFVVEVDEPAMGLALLHPGRPSARLRAAHRPGGLGRPGRSGHGVPKGFCR